LLIRAFRSKTPLANPSRDWARGNSERGGRRSGHEVENV
jgi:hypothetical protein